MAEVNPTSPLLHFGPFELDLRTSQLQKSGSPVHLAPQPSKVLALLASKPGQLVTREEIRQQVWGNGTFVDYEQGLRFAIKKIRAALGDNPEKPHYIETLPRRGYRFIAHVQAAAPADESPSNSVQVDGHSTEGSGWMSGILKPWTRLAVLLSGSIIMPLAVLVWAGWIVLRAELPTPPRSNNRIHSLAVLPLENLSGNTSQEYFVDGMTDELTTELAKAGNLRVISRTSSMQYKGKHKFLPEIARELNVDAVVMGTVQRSGDRVRLRVQLVRAAADEHLWAQSYDRDLSDPLRLEAEVAHAIAREVRARLDTGLARGRLARRSPINLEAYDSYLRARYFSQKLTRDGTAKCISNFQKAVVKAPHYAGAYAGLAGCYQQAQLFRIMATQDGYNKMKTAATQAIDLDDELAEAHAMLGEYEVAYAWDWGAAERELRRAIELDPSSAPAHFSYSHLLLAMGRTDDAVAEMQRAQELDPVSLAVASATGWTLLYSRRYEQALTEFRRVLDLDPTHTNAHWGIVRVYMLEGKFKEVIAEREKHRIMLGQDPASILRHSTALTAAYDAFGANGFWQELLKVAYEDLKSGRSTWYDIAVLQAQLGDRARALSSLEKAYLQHDPGMVVLKVDPRLDNVRSFPRFQDLVREVGLADDDSSHP